ncbi:MAG TPA: competence/damage-inducible protein A, partial [Thermoanaerobaculia bacterium]|nr:competence/damage-inducible protein A [Thermoanaerobaculia bacterium]
MTTASIIAIGSEMLGPVRVDTNSLRITAALENRGIGVVRKSVVGDDLDTIVAELEWSITSSDIVVVTGGLGPTDDDLTRAALVKAFGLDTEVDPSIIERIEARFAARGWTMPAVNRRQGVVFRGQETLQNEVGTAPGFHLRVRGKDVWVFPGVPQELDWMIEKYFRPWLAERSGGVTRCRRV